MILSLNNHLGIGLPASTNLKVISTGGNRKLTG